MIGPAGSGFPTPPGLGSRPHCSISCNTDVRGGASRPSSYGETPTGARPDRSGRAPRPRCRRCARQDFVGRRRGAQLLTSSQRISLVRRSPSAWERTAVPTWCTDVAGEFSARRHRFDAKSSVAQAILLSPGHNDGLEIPDESLVLYLVPANDHRPTDRGRRCRHAGGGQLAIQLSCPAGLRGVRCPSLGCAWLLSR